MIGLQYVILYRYIFVHEFFFGILERTQYIIYYNFFNKKDAIFRKKTLTKKNYGFLNVLKWTLFSNVHIVINF